LIYHFIYNTLLSLYQIKINFIEKIENKTKQINKTTNRKGYQAKMNPYSILLFPGHPDLGHHVSRISVSGHPVSRISVSGDPVSGDPVSSHGHHHQGGQDYNDRRSHYSKRIKGNRGRKGQQSRGYSVSLGQDRPKISIPNKKILGYRDHNNYFWKLSASTYRQLRKWCEGNYETNIFTILNRRIYYFNFLILIKNGNKKSPLEARLL
jgi:hypothetical protein